MAMKPRPVGAPMRAKPVSSAFDAGDRKTRKVLLPSLRVACFVFPNVGDLLTMQSDALVSQGDRVVGTGLALALRATALRKLLKGLSMPVPAILKDGADYAVAADAAEAALLAEQAKKAEKDRLSDEALERAVAEARNLAELACEDVPAMIASANLQRVEDAQWDVDGYLIDVQKADIGTLEAADWIALNNAAMDLTQELSALASGATADPKARVRTLLPRS